MLYLLILYYDYASLQGLIGLRCVLRYEPLGATIVAHILLHWAHNLAALSENVSHEFLPADRNSAAKTTAYAGNFTLFRARIFASEKPVSNTKVP